MVVFPLPALIQERPSIILNLNSGLGFVPKTGSAIHCATKGAINLLSQSLRHQLEQTNIRVMQAFLPLVDTQMTKGRGSGKLTPEDAAASIIKGLEGSKLDIDMGKVRILRFIHRCMPWLARRIMKAG